MASKRMYEDLEEILCHEMNEITRKGEIDRESLDDLYKLLSTSIMVESRMRNSSYDPMMDGMSGMSTRNLRMPMMSGGNYAYDSYMNAYGDESYRRGRNQTTGRYMSRDSYDEGSYERGYSRHSAEEKAIMKMEEIAETTQNPKVRQAVMQAVETLERQ